MAVLQRKNRLKRVLALSAALVLSCGIMSGCQSTRFVGTVDGYEVRSGVYLYYQSGEAYSDTYEKLPEEYKTIFHKKTMVTDEEGTEMTAKAYIEKRTKQYVKEFVATERKFEELGLSFTEEEIADFTSTANEHYQSNEDVFTLNGIGPESIRDVVLNVEKHNRIFEYYYADDGETPVSKEDKMAFFTGDYALIKILMVETYNPDNTPKDEAGIAEAKKVAADYAAKATAENMDELIAEVNANRAKVSTEFAMRAEAEAADEEAEGTDSADSGTESTDSAEGTNSAEVTDSADSTADEAAAPPPTEEEIKAAGDAAKEEALTADATALAADPNKNDILVIKEQENAPEAILNAAIDAEVGEVFEVENEGICYVGVKYDLSKREDIFEAYNDIIIRQIKGEEFNKMVAEWGNALEAQWNSFAVNHFDPDKITLPDYMLDPNNLMPGM